MGGFVPTTQLQMVAKEFFPGQDDEILEYSGVLPDRFRYTGPWKNLLVCDWLFQSEESNDTDDDID
ncbi:MAG: hypothetical protein U9P90_00135, partial [Patescibacteria group bacterium]|nr:hypothetical protein [Patescibacteria group bacterium]